MPADAAPQLDAISTEFATLTERLTALGEPPEQAAVTAAQVGQALELLGSAYLAHAQGAASGHATLIDQGTVELAAGAEALGQVADSQPDCAADADSENVASELATPDETSLTVFFRLAESLLGATNSPYAGTTPEVLTESAHASCRVLLDGGDIRQAIEAAIEASPLAAQTFASSEQQYVLLVVTRGAQLWCPSVITDEEAFTAEVISTLVDVFFDG